MATNHMEDHRNAIADVWRAELNEIRAWMTALKAEISAVADLADLKSAVARLPETRSKTETDINLAIDAALSVRAAVDPII